MAKLKDLQIGDLLQLLDSKGNTELAGTYEELEIEIESLRKICGSVPRLTEQLMSVEETPRTKGTLQTAARDISFNEAIFELIDNSIDEWMKRQKPWTLECRITLDSTSSTGLYEDNAGGIRRKNLRTLFIPGETTNTPEFITIGSFGLGAKKALFTLSDGVTIISRFETQQTWLKTAPVGFVDSDSWDIPEARVDMISPYTTKIVLQNLQIRITDSRINRLVEELGYKYELYIREGNLKILVNNLPKVEAAKYPDWTGAEGLEPREYHFDFTIDRHHRLEGPFLAKCVFQCGILRSQSKQKAPGIDVYGNGRLIVRNRNYHFGIGYLTGLARPGSAGNLLKARLNIEAPSFIIPWDTHKRSIQGYNDHRLTNIITYAILPILSSFLSEIRRCTSRGRKGTLEIFRPTRFLGNFLDEHKFEDALAVVRNEVQEPPNFYPHWPYDFPAPRERQFEIAFEVTSEEFDFLLAKYEANNKTEVSRLIKEDALSRLDEAVDTSDYDAIEAMEDDFSDDILVPLMEGGYTSIVDILATDSGTIADETGLDSSIIERVKHFLQEYIRSSD